MLAIIQIVSAAAITLAVVLIPPAHGRMLLLPGINADARPAALLTPGLARLIAPGPLPGSLVVIGDRATLLPAATARGVAVFAAPALLCGTPEERIGR